MAPGGGGGGRGAAPGGGGGERGAAWRRAGAAGRGAGVAPGGGEAWVGVWRGAGRGAWGVAASELHASSLPSAGQTGGAWVPPRVDKRPLSGPRETGPVDDQQLGRLIRAVRLRRRMRQVDLASAASLSHATVSLVERGHCRKLSLETLRGIASALDVRIEVAARWRGGDVDRLLSHRHSLLADSFASFMRTAAGWIAEAEVSFSIYGERGVIDELAWHPATGHLLVIELKTEFVDINEMLGTLDRKIRLARTVAADRRWTARKLSYWVIVSETRTNRRHAAQHSALLRSRLRLDGRQLRPFLRNPAEATSGLAFWTNSNRGSASPESGRDPARVRLPRGVQTVGKSSHRAG